MEYPQFRNSNYGQPHEILVLCEILEECPQELNKQSYRQHVNRAYRQALDDPEDCYGVNKAAHSQQRHQQQPKKITRPTRRVYAWQDCEIPQRQGYELQDRMPDLQTNTPCHKHSKSKASPFPMRSEVGVCTKYLLFVENFLAFILGGALLGMSIYILVLKKNKTIIDTIDFFLDPSCLTCLAASLLTAVAFLGFYGSLRENSIILRIYFYLMLLLVVGQMLVCILVFAAYYSADLKTKIFPTSSFDKAIVKYRDDIDMQNMIDTIQEGLQCCGMTDSDLGFLDWNQNPYFKCSKTSFSPERCSVPSSCCKLANGKIVNHQCGWNTLRVEQDGTVSANDVKYISNIYTIGCLKSVTNWINDNALVLGGILIGIIFPQIFLIILTSNLMTMIQKQKDRWTK